jgi:tryptophan synthase alpha subunit
MSKNQRLQGSYNTHRHALEDALCTARKLHAQMPLMALTYVNVIMRPLTSAGFLQDSQTPPAATVLVST